MLECPRAQRGTRRVVEHAAGEGCRPQPPNLVRCERCDFVVDNLSYAGLPEPGETRTSEAHQAIARAKPQVAVSCLGDGIYRRSGKSGFLVPVVCTESIHEVELEHANRLARRLRRGLRRSHAWP